MQFFRIRLEASPIVIRAKVDIQGKIKALLFAQEW